MGWETINDILRSTVDKSLATVNGLGLLISHLAYLRQVPRCHGNYNKI